MDFPKVVMSQKQQKKLFFREMAEFANAAAVLKAWNMIILSHFLAEAAVISQIFSCYVKHAIGVNQIVATAKSIIKK
jgi:hypothetical protein